MKWKWSNVPIPEQHLVGLILGIVLELAIQSRILAPHLLLRLAGALVTAAGIIISVWAVIEAGNVSVDSPDALLTSGPFSYSRNPMYLAWTIMFVGVALIANSWLMIVPLPFVAVYTHFVDVRKDERFLEDKFGDGFLRYKSQVRRYF